MYDLLSNCTSGGCGAKIGPGELDRLLSGLEGGACDALMVGFGSRDDAAVYRLSHDLAVVSTVDFFSPMVNDPALFGRIAAANALSDVYAMGGEPLLALNLVCFPEKLDKSVLGQILQGGAEKLREAGVPLSGGHSIYDREIKYGLAVTGRVHPNRLLRNNTCRQGDLLVLTKALGVGIVMAAHRVGLADPAHFRSATASMERLNGYAARAARDFPVHACTDVTGFGLLAHLCEMAGDSATLELWPDALPALPGAQDYAAQYLVTAAGQRNRRHVEQRLDQAALEALPAPLQELMLDPQTSGGLLFSVSPEAADGLLQALWTVAPESRVIGVVLPRDDRAIRFRSSYTK